MSAGSGDLPSGSICDHPIVTKVRSLEEAVSRGLGFLDVGARDGVWPVISPIASCTDVIAFDPDEAACEEIAQQRDTRWRSLRILPVGLWDRSGTATLHACSKATNHSLLPVNRHLSKRYDLTKFAPAGSFEVKVASLDDLRADGILPRSFSCEFLKLDTQGSEYQILQGARRLLEEETLAAVVEVSFLQIYRDQALFGEIELFLRQKGFSFYGFLSLTQRSCKRLDKLNHIGRERFFQADAVFLKDPFDREGVSLESSQASKLFLIAIVLGYFDFALELMPLFTVSDGERQHLTQFVSEISRETPESVCAELKQICSQPSQLEAYVAFARMVENRRWLWNLQDIGGDVLK